MLLKSPTGAPSNVLPMRNLERQLEDLYARRSAIDELIQSLQDYERFRAKSGVEITKRKLA